MKVVAEGPADPVLIAIAEGPGAKEIQSGRPLIGPTGELLQKAFTLNKLKRRDVWLTNTALCSVKDASDEDRRAAAKCCSKRLEHELAQFDVKIPILALGAVASEQLITSEFKITQIAGTYHQRPDGREIIPTVHPAAILRGGTGDANHGSDLGFWSLIYDVQKVVALAQGKDIRFKADVLPVLDNPALAEHLVLSICAAARELGSISIDTETYADHEKHSALELPRALLKAVGLATPFGAVCFPWATCTDATAEALKELLADKTVIKNFHNGAYDIPVLTHHGMPVLGPLDDTLLMHHNAFPGLAHGLQRVASQFQAIPPWKSEHDRAEGTDGMQGLLEYCARDTLAAARLTAPLQICIKRSNAEKTYEVDQMMLRVATDMHMNGIPFDREINRELNDQFSKVIENSRKAIEADATSDVMFERVLDELAFEQAKQRRKKDSADIEERHAKRLQELRKRINSRGQKRYQWSIGNSNDVIAYLKARGVRFSKYTETGRTQINKDVLENISHIPEAKDVIEFREAAKMLSTYVKVMPFFECPDGRIRPSWSVNKITGRWASEFPNFMSVPGADPKKGRPNLRKQVVAPKGRRLVSFDFCFAEGTMVDTPTGPKPIESIRPGDLVYSYDTETHRVKCGKVTKSAKTGYQPTVKVIIDNGAEIRCTRDHRWLTRQWGKAGQAFETEAQDLRPGTRLLPLRKSYAGPVASRYETLYSYSAFEYSKTHVEVTETLYGPVPAGFVSHHKDGNKLNNAPDNLEYVDQSTHASAHTTAMNTRYANDPKLFAKRSEKLSKSMSESVKARGGYGGERNPRYGQRKHPAGTCPNCDGVIDNVKVVKKFCSTACYAEFRQKNNGVARGTKWSDLNHKVVEVIDDGLVLPVYDITVDKYHNFALAAGVFVHNCALEGRVIALLSDDDFMVNVFARGEDIHDAFSRELWGPRFDQVDAKVRKVLRNATKRFEFGAFYGGAIDTLWKTIKKDDPRYTRADVAKALDVLVKATYGVQAWHEELIRKVAQPPFEIRSHIYGRRRVYPLGNAPPTETYNFGVQSTGADLMARGLLNFLPRLKSTDLIILQVHDCLVVETDEDDVDRIKQAMRESFIQECFTASGRSVVFTIDVNDGQSWADV